MSLDPLPSTDSADVTQNFFDYIAEIESYFQSAEVDRSRSSEQLKKLLLELQESESKVKMLHEQLSVQGEVLKQVQVERDEFKDQKQEASEEGELTLLRLHEVQEELEQMSLRLQEKDARINSLQDQLSAKGEVLKQVQIERDEFKDQKQEASEEGELTLLQLHQVHEELEHYFLAYQASEQAHQASKEFSLAQQDQLNRAQSLMSRLLPEASVNPTVRTLEVEVLSPALHAPSVQLEALLDSYASSLHRARLLLQRALRG